MIKARIMFGGDIIIQSIYRLFEFIITVFQMQDVDALSSLGFIRLKYHI